MMVFGYIGSTYHNWVCRPISPIIARNSEPLEGYMGQVDNKLDDVLSSVSKNSSQKYKNTFISCFHGFCSAKLSKKSSCFEVILIIQTTQCPTGDGQ